MIRLDPSRARAPRLLAVVFAACLAFPAAAPAQEEAAPPPRDEQALAAMREMLTLQREMKSYAFKGTISIKMDLSGLGIDPAAGGGLDLGELGDMKMAMNMSVERPNKFRLENSGEGFLAMMGQTMVSDGTKMYLYMPAFNAYSEQEAPATLEEMAATAAMSMGPAAMGNLAGGDMDVDASIAAVESAIFVGEEEFDGVPCRRIRVVQGAEGATMSADMWIEKGETPLLRRMIPDLSGMAAAMEDEDFGPGVGNPFSSTEMEIVYSDWKVNPEFPADAFAFTPPEGAQKTDDPGGMLGALGGMGGFGGDAGGEFAGRDPMELIGEPAPEIALTTLDGQPFKLSDHKGKVVILDFWATWCGPCVKAMPLLVKTAKAYADKGVLLFAVNLGEDADTVKQFLKREKIDAKVVLDPEGATGEAYRADAIPQTVVIGKDGVVRKVHVGFDPGLDKTLAAELDELLK